ncbi:hypothetical protein GHT06_020534 [Daphnia sinensis]|uniref:RNase H type-1 domain-containing protein n=1 Tax=Daphnia sinensis TaxID=1820382 RepID=A0AAD5L7W8_9CRUS|nr:hypothetical protein GHT06_020534 [Daphnia sinensis]
MLGKGSNLSPDGTTIKVGETTFNTPEEKAKLFVDLFSSAYPSNIPENCRCPNILNEPITMEEIDKCLQKSKSRVVGIDLIQNSMLRNLSKRNKCHLRQLFNILLSSGHVPAQWKKSIVIPLLKPNKKADDPSAYRPISLMPCLCKALERVIANRLHWGGETADHIIQLKTDIKLSFSRRQSTVAVFLDLAKAYDTEFITGRSRCVRIGDQDSHFKTIENGVPQEAVLSPIFFNIILSDFPLHPSPPPEIEQVTKHCQNFKKSFTIIANKEHGPPIQTLLLLFKSLVRSKIDLGQIDYGNANKTNLEKINVVCKSIIRNMLGSRNSTPTEMLYAESCLEPVAVRRSWLTSKYIIDLDHKPNNPMYNTARKLYFYPDIYPARGSPCLETTMEKIKSLDLDTFPDTSPLPSLHSYPPPSRPPECSTWCSKSSKNITTCAAIFPAINVAKAWTLQKDSSVFSAELQAINQALRFVYNMENSPKAVTIFIDSSPAIKAITSVDPSKNEAITDIQELIGSLKSSGTRITLAWTSSHVGMEGNVQADKRATLESVNQSGVTVSHRNKRRTKTRSDYLASLKKCQKRSIQTMSSLKPRVLHWQKNRKIAIYLHQLRAGHHYLHSFAHPINPENDPNCRLGCQCDANQDNLLGLNTSVSTQTQIKIRDLVAKFLHQQNVLHLLTRRK